MEGNVDGTVEEGTLEGTIMTGDEVGEVVG